jgi:hypothetical protein|nr:MAG TPA: hypothetical protein [Caudoviricetes sp.]
MLLSNSRIEKNKRVQFYEQDILLDDHIYSGNLQVTIDLDYISPGIGIALVSDEGLSLNEDGETYLFRVGHSDYSIVRRYGDKVEVLENGPAINIKPFKENMKLQIKKINSRVYFYVNDKLLSKKYLPTNLESFMIGYYSNAGNIINSISIASEIPEGWVVNMSNTNGGYINFYPNAFAVTNCLDKAEVEQVKIKLKANTPNNPYYYLRYNKELINECNDFNAFIFISDDDRYVDEDKNILDKYNRFILKDDTEVNLKFVGTIGKIKDIQISDRKDDFYVGTDYEMTEIKESFIKIKTNDIVKIEWSGVIYGTPEYNIDIPNPEKFGVIKDNDKIYYPDQCGVEIGKEFKYEYTLELNKNNPKDKLIIKRDKETNYLDINVIDQVTIFENVDAIIDKLVLYKEDGTIVDIIVEDTKKQYVPSSIKSPIIVTTETEEPLDLSSSYRVIEKDGIANYVFTNIERETFNPSNRLKLTNRPSSKLDTIVIYGVLKESNINEDKIMHSVKENIRDISLYADNFEIINEASMYRVNKDTGIIVITDQDDNYIKSKYSKLVVDYLKNNSYAINYRHELGSYEVDISTSENTKMYYDGIYQGDNKELVNIQEYKLLNTVFKNNSYIVLREGDK